MLPFVIAQCSTLLLAVAIFVAFRPVIRALGDTAKSHFQLYGVAYVKGACLILLAVGGTFKETWAPITAEQASQFAVWDWIIKLSAPLLAGISVLAAFLDRSMQSADDKKAEQDARTNPPFPRTP